MTQARAIKSVIGTMLAALCAAASPARADAACDVPEGAAFRLLGNEAGLTDALSGLGPFSAEGTNYSEDVPRYLAGSSVHVTGDSVLAYRVEGGGPTPFSAGIGDFTISGWFKVSQAESMVPVIDTRSGEDSGTAHGYVIAFLAGSNELIFQMMDGAGYTNHKFQSGAIAADTWAHVTVSVDRDSASGGKVFVSGEMVGTFDPTDRQGSLGESTELVFNDDGHKAGRQGSGLWLHRFHYFPRALSDSEIGLLASCMDNLPDLSRLPAPGIEAAPVIENSGEEGHTPAESASTDEWSDYNDSILRVQTISRTQTETVYRAGLGVSAYLIPPGSGLRIALEVSFPASVSLSGEPWYVLNANLLDDGFVCPQLMIDAGGAFASMQGPATLVCAYEDAQSVAVLSQVSPALAHNSVDLKFTHEGGFKTCMHARLYSMDGNGAEFEFSDAHPENNRICFSSEEGPPPMPYNME